MSDTTFRFTLGESGFMVASDGLWAAASWAEIQLRGHLLARWWKGIWEQVIGLEEELPALGSGSGHP